MPSRKHQPHINDDSALSEVAARYSVAVTPAVTATMRSADTETDPVARQYLPTAAELVTTPDECDDPIGDSAHAPVKGIVHRYPDRVLLKPVHVCAVYCRFCFRREKVGTGAEGLSAGEMAAALDYIRQSPRVWEVIVTGGDPFVLSPRRLGELVRALDAIPHVEVIRFHTRVPVADPARINDALVAALASRKAVYVVVHVNHAQELTEDVRAAAARLSAAGIPLLSQSVLLRGVNDDPAVLENLFRRLTAMKIKPYYLHHPDKPPGTSHFRLTIARGREIVGQLAARLSGIARPAYVLDIPGGHGKVPLLESPVEKDADGYAVTDPKGKTHRYRD